MAVLEADLPAMQRTGDLRAVHDALRQRPALMRTAIIQSKDLIIGVAKHGDIAARAPHHPRPETRNVIHAAYPLPFAHRRFPFRAAAHAGSNSIAWNSRRLSSSVTRSCQGSLSPDNA